MKGQWISGMTGQWITMNDRQRNTANDRQKNHCKRKASESLQMTGQRIQNPCKWQTKESLQMTCQEPLQMTRQIITANDWSKNHCKWLVKESLQMTGQRISANFMTGQRITTSNWPNNYGDTLYFEAVHYYTHMYYKQFCKLLALSPLQLLRSWFFNIFSQI